MFRPAAVLLLLLIAAPVPGDENADTTDPWRRQPGQPPGALAGEEAPDGLGVVVSDSAGAGELRNKTWVEGTHGEALIAGQEVPSGIVVRTLENEAFDLNAAIAQQPTILMFYRGGWCPFCNIYLKDLQNVVPDLRDMGYQVLAIGSDPPDRIMDELAGADIDYTLLSDQSLDVAARFGLRYKVKRQYIDHVLAGRQVDIAARNGGYLLTPAAYIIDTDGVILFAYANRNYTVRLKNDVLLARAREALK